MSDRSNQAPTLPPYIYGSEAGAHEKVWPEHAVTALAQRVEELTRAHAVAVELGATYAARVDELAREVERLRDLREFAVDTAEEIDAARKGEQHAG